MHSFLQGTWDAKNVQIWYLSKNNWAPILYYSWWYAKESHGKQDWQGFYILVEIKILTKSS